MLDPRKDTESVIKITGEINDVIPLKKIIAYSKKQEQKKVIDVPDIEEGDDEIQEDFYESPPKEDTDEDNSKILELIVLIAIIVSSLYLIIYLHIKNMESNIMIKTILYSAVFGVTSLGIIVARLL